MMVKAFSVYDKAVKAFMPPFFARTAGEAIRSFTELANDPKTNVAQYPSDFVLWSCGEFDDSSGVFAVVEPQRILGAYEVVRDYAPPVKEMQPVRSNGHTEMPNAFKEVDRPD